MESNKSIMESLFHNLARIMCITILFIFFRSITYKIIMKLNIIDRLSLFSVVFYVSLLQVGVIFFILKHGFKKEDKIIKREDKGLVIDLFDIFIFLFIGLLLGSIIYEGLFCIEDIINAGSKYESNVTRALISGLEVTNLDKIYSIISGVILGPLAEELFFRKGVFEYFADKEVKSRDVILISGISFGLTHSIGLAIPTHAIITGIIFAVMYVTTDNVIYPIIGHGLNNLMSFIVDIFRDNSGIEDIEAYIEAGNLITIRGAIIISLILLIITSIISYIKRKTIISSDFKKSLRRVFTE